MKNFVKVTLRILILFTQIIVLSVFQISEAVAAPAISLPSTFVATTSFANVNGAGTLSVSDYGASTIQVNVSVSSGNIKLTSTANLTAPTGYSSGDWTSGTATSFAFSGSQSDVNTALNSLQFKASSIGTTGTITVASFVAGGAFDSSSNHFYEAITGSSVISWELARCKAKYSNADITVTAGTSTNSSNSTAGYESTVAQDRCSSSTTLTRRTLGGLRGYLANITSLEEHNFIRGKLSSVGWIGGADTDLEGTWKWMDGPESGQTFFIQGTSTTLRGSNTIDGRAMFNYWSDNEPNNASNEDFAEFGFGSAGVGSSWNDCRNGCSRTNYVIEYGDTGDTLSGASGNISFTTKPIPTISPAITGTNSYGQTLSSNTGTWGNTPTAYSYQWSRSSSVGGTYTSISGATSSSYVLMGADVGQYLKVAVTASNSAGATTDTSTASAQIQAVPITIQSATRLLTYTGSAVSSSNGYSITSGSLIGSDTFTALTYTYTSANPVYNSTTPPTDAGTYTVTPSAPTFSVGSSLGYTITYATSTLTISKASQTITFNTLSNRTKTNSIDTFTASASTTSLLSVSFSSSTPTKCAVSSTTVTLLAPGTCTINADQAGNTNYNAASQVSQSFTIADTLTITTPSSGLGSTRNYPFTLSITASGGAGNNVYAINSGTLPTGLSLNTTTGVISGTPTSIGSSNLTIKVTDSNTAAATTASFTLTVNQINSITSTTSTITQKYGSGRSTRSITSTGGTDTKTVTASSNSLAGGKILFSNGVLTIDTSTPVGTYYDTITVTDALGAVASYVQQISVTVADTLTVQADTLTAITYSPYGMSINTTSTISGLIESDSQSSITYTFSEPASTCAGGGTCSLGDTGPGGGTIYYISGSTYYEAAPKTWYSTVTYNGSSYTNSNIHFCSDANYFHKNTNFSYTINTGWGGGQSNTAAFVSNGCPTGVVALSQQYRGGGLSDWYVPNETELNGLVTYWSNLNSLSTQFAAMSNSFYWTSNATTWNATYGWLFTQPYFNAGGTWTLAGAAYNNQTGLFVPIRKFTSAGGSENLIGNPTNAGTYTITPSALTLANGVSTSNYANIIYRSSTFVINKATQDTLTITSKLGTYNGGSSTMKITTAGGSDTGTVTYSIVTGGSATGCSITGITLTFTSAGTCKLTANKAATRNYLIAYADTVTITLSAFVSNQQVQTQSVPTQLPINGANSLETTTVSVSTLAISSATKTGAGAHTISGTGFNNVSVVRIGGSDLLVSNYTVANSTTINLTGVAAYMGPLFIRVTDGQEAVFFQIDWS